MKEKVSSQLLLGIIITLAVIILSSGSAAAADVSDEAGLEDALIGSDSTITLTGGFTLTKDITISRDVTLTGGAVTLNTDVYSLLVASGGHLTVDGELTITGCKNQSILVKDGGKFTLNNGNITCFDEFWHDHCAVYIEDEGTVNINSGTVISNDSKSKGAIFAEDGAVTLNISGGKITGYTSAITLNQDFTTNRSIINISGGVIDNDSTNSYIGIYVKNGNITINGNVNIKTPSIGFAISADGGTIDISDGIFEGNLSLENCDTVKISGGTYKGAINPDTSLYQGGDITIDGQTSVIIAGGTVGGTIILEDCTAVDISGGTFTGIPGAAIQLSNIGNTYISGGTFASEAPHSSGINIESVKSGNKVSISGDAKIEGKTNGITIANGTVNIANGATISGGEYGLRISTNGKADVSGGTIIGYSYGSIFIPDNNDNSGELTLRGGTIINADSGPNRYGIYIEKCSTNKINHIECSGNLTISASAILCYKGSSDSSGSNVLSSLPKPIIMATDETNIVTIGVIEPNKFTFTLDTVDTSPELYATKSAIEANSFSVNPTTAGIYNLVLSGKRTGESSPFLTLTIPVSVVYNVTYDANGGTGTPPEKIYIDENDSFEAAAADTFTPPNDKLFNEWNSKSDGTGTSYSAGAQITMGSENLVLYAIWKDPTTPTYDISLNQTNTYTFTEATEGYTSVTPLTVTISNTGNQPTGDLTVVLSGMNSGDYTLSKTTVTSIDVSSTDTFTISPSTGLAVGTYTATITVSGDGYITAQTFSVNFTVISVPIVNASISPAVANFDKYSPADVETTITWNSATAVTDVTVGSTTIGTDNYEIFGSILTIKKGHLATQSIGDLVLTIEFNKGDSAELTVNIVDTYTPPGNNNQGGGGGGGSKSSSITPGHAYTVDPDSGTASVDLGSQSLGAGETVVNIPPISGVNSYSVSIGVSSLATTDGQGSLTLTTNVGNITLPSDMLTGLSDFNGNNVEITIGQGDASKLPEDVRAAIGDRPIISLSLSLDGEQTDWNNPNAPVTVNIPYTPTEAELANPESIVIWYIDGSGNAVSVPNAHYDPVTGTVIFTTTHFSDFAVIYNPISFNDVADNAWCAKAVSFIAARDISSGTGGGDFSPNAKLTRGQFIVMLMNAYGIAPDTDPVDNFQDAGNTYYTCYLAAAKRLGIAAGTGNNLYSPDKKITRQEMFTLLYNALNQMSMLPKEDNQKNLSDFTDEEQIASWACDAMTLLVKADIVCGSGGRLSPLNTTSRAEMAQVLYNLLGN